MVIMAHLVCVYGRMSGVPSRNNALQGDFGEAWLEAVAAGCGFKTHGVTRPTPVPDADPWDDAGMSKEGRQ